MTLAYPLAYRSWVATGGENPSSLRSPMNEAPMQSTTNTTEALDRAIADAEGDLGCFEYSEAEREALYERGVKLLDVSFEDQPKADRLLRILITRAGHYSCSGEP